MSSLWLKLDDGTLVPVPNAPLRNPIPSQIESQHTEVEFGTPGLLITTEVVNASIPGLPPITAVNDTATARAIRFELSGWINSAIQTAVYVNPHAVELNGTATLIGGVRVRQQDMGGSNWYTLGDSFAEYWLAPGDSLRVVGTAYIDDLIGGDAPVELRYRWRLDCSDLGPMTTNPNPVVALPVLESAPAESPICATCHQRNCVC